MPQSTDHDEACSGDRRRGSDGTDAGRRAGARGVDVAIVERRANQELAGARAGGLHSRTIEVLDQRGIAERFLCQGQIMQVAGFALIPLDISDFPTRHNYGLALKQEGIERTLAAWVDGLAVPTYRGFEVQDETGVDVSLGDGRSLRAKDLVGCDGGRSLVRRNAGIDWLDDGKRVRLVLNEPHLTERDEPTLDDLRPGAHRRLREGLRCSHLRDRCRAVR
jgi:3-(3-hydroxy-phenyl)propionate hydroxylase